MKERYRIEILDKKDKTKNIVHVHGLTYNVKYRNTRIQNLNGPTQVVYMGEDVTLSFSNPRTKTMKKKGKRK